MRCSRCQPALPTHPLDRATLVPSPTSLIADLDTLIARRAPPTQTLARYKSRALLAFEYHAVSKRGALCPPLTTHVACSAMLLLSSANHSKQLRCPSDSPTWSNQAPGLSCSVCTIIPRLMTLVCPLDDRRRLIHRLTWGGGLAALSAAARHIDASLAIVGAQRWPDAGPRKYGNVPWTPSRQAD